MEPLKKNIRLSKSKFLVGCQCLKRLYLLCYQQDLAAPPDETLLAKFEQGHEVGRLATRAFPGGVLVEEDHVRHREATVRTRELMADASVPAIFEAAFSFEDVHVRVDILDRQPGDRWRMIEVKSTARLKDYHYQDVAIQKYVLEGCGLNLSEACLMHLNRDYVYDGREHDLRWLFIINDLTSDLQDSSQEIPVLLMEQRRTLALDGPPEIEPGEHCSDPFECEFSDYCYGEIPEHWVGTLPRITKKLMRELVEQGIEVIYDIPEDFGLTELQKRACLCVKSGETYIGQELPRELKTLQYPLYFTDFETFSPPIPRYAGMRPFDQIPFQWSVHVRKRPGGPLEHYEFLAADKSDPREAFIEGLLKVMEDGGSEGHIITYYASFETGRLDDLAEWLPQYAPRIARIKDRLWDLHPIVQQHVYHPEFYGSFSLKKVLPALVPHMTYEGLEVADGVEASLAYDKMIQSGINEEERKKLRKSLFEYCNQDTLAMIELIRAFEKERCY
jgi:predicted RecB family nuclease